MARFNLQKLASGSVLVLVLVMTGSASVQAQSYDSQAAAAAEVRFQQLEKEVRRLTGQIEEQNFKIRTLEEELARQAGDLSVRMSDLEGGHSASSSDGGNAMPSQTSPADSYAQGGGAMGHEPIDAPTGDMMDSGEDSQDSFYTPPDGNREPGQLGTLKQSPETGEVSRGNTEADEYERAYAYIKSRDFASAEAAFAEFIDKYPNSSYMTNAKYWYGETFYVRGNYEQAARIFAESYQSNPKGGKAAGNLLKLGMSLAGLGKKDDACVAFKQLKKDYASSAVPILKRADTEMRKIGCN